MLSPVFTVYQDRRFVFFAGPQWDNGYLSNWYETHFMLDSHEFENSEQAFLYLKALRSGDEATAHRVFAMSDPAYFARLSKQIRPFDARTWAGRREATMRQVVHEKFLQNEELCDSLLATEDATIVSCTGNVLWSCGLGINDPRRLDPANWVGHNLLGTILMDLREELRPPVVEPEPEVEPESEPQSETAPAETSEQEPDAVAAATTAVTSESAVAVAAKHAELAVEAESEAAPAIEKPSEPADTTLPTETEDAIEEAQPVEEDVGKPEADSTTQLPVIAEDAATTAEPPASQTAEVTQPAASEQQAVDDSLDPVVKRYVSGDAPTAGELSDGSVLKHLMRLFSQQDSPEVRTALMQCLRDSVVVVPASKVDPLVAATVPVREDGTADPLVMDSGKTYRPNVLENARGDRWFPAFSSADEVDEQVRSQATLLSLPMSQCVEVARTHGGLAGIIVNVFSENLILPGKTCDYIASLAASWGE